MRYYQTATVASGAHRFWLDGLVLISTVMFGLLLGYFILDVLPRSGAAAAASTARAAAPKTSRFSFTNPLAIFFPSLTTLPAVPIGQAQQVNGIVAQAVSPRRSHAEGGREANSGTEFMSLTVVLDNQGKQAFSYNLSDFEVRDSKGRMHTAENLRGTGWLSGGTIDPGQRVQGAVVFLIPEGDAGPQVTFTSSPLRAILRWDVAG
jgi:hypothetical protein